MDRSLLRPSRMRAFVFASLVALVCGCSAGESEEPEEDEAFTADWVEDYESDLAEDAAEEIEQNEIDAIDDLDDVDPLDPSEAPDLSTAGLAPRPKAPASSHGPLSILTDQPGFEIGWNAPGDPGLTLAGDARAAEAAALGADVIRVFVYWDQVAPGGRDARTSTKRPKFDATNPDRYDWRKTDLVIRRARNQGMRVLLTLSAPMPCWASEEPEHCAADYARTDDGWISGWKPKPREYARFVTAFGRHLRKLRKTTGFVPFGVTLWNEPNVRLFLEDDTSEDAAMRYRRMWFAGRKHLRKTAGVKTRIFFGDTANSENFSTSSKAWSFFRYALCLTPKTGDPLPKKEHCPLRPRKVWPTGIAFHPYASAPSLHRKAVELLESLADDAATEGKLPKNRGIYLTEAGYLTADKDDALGAGIEVTEAQQSTYIRLTEHANWEDRRVKTVAQYNVYFERAWDSGLRREDGSPKPAYRSYAIPMVLSRTGTNEVEVWGLVRFAGRSSFAIQAQVGGAWVTRNPAVPTDALGYGVAKVPIDGATAFRILWGDETDVSDTLPTP